MTMVNRIEIEEVAFEIIPGRVRYVIQDNTQAIVIEFLRTQGRTKERLQGLRVLDGPIGNRGLAVVALREDVRQPTQRQVAVRQTLVQVMRPHMLVHDFS